MSMIQSQPSPAFTKLKETLKLPHYQAVGIVTILQHITKGGRLLTPESLAVAMDWDGNVEGLYEALVDCGYLVPMSGRN